MKTIGYARRAIDDGKLKEQVDHLRRHGCETVFAEYGSGTSPALQERQKAIHSLGRGDRLVVEDIARLSRDPRLYTAMLNQIESLGAQLVVIERPTPAP